MRIFTKGWLLLLAGIFLLSAQNTKAQDVVYLRTYFTGNYWGQNGNAEALDRAFGTDGWTRRNYETVDLDELFGPDHKVIFVDGSQLGTCEFVDFYTKNQLLFEEFVNQGGALFINIASTECNTDPIDLGFGGVQSFNELDKQEYDARTTNPNHPVFVGPESPAYADKYEGGKLALNYLTGGDLLPLLVMDNSELLTLGEKLWGDGLVVFGGLTLEFIGQHSMWAPEPELSNLYDNILLYLHAFNKEACTDLPVMITQNIELNLDDLGNASIVADQIDNGSSSACGELVLTLDQAEFACLSVGNNTVLLTGTDVNDQSVSAPAIVIVKDVTAPNVATKNITLALDELGTVNITPQDVDNGSSDACGIGSMSIDFKVFDCTNVGDNLVTLTVLDKNANAASTTATVTVIDNIGPLVVTKDITIALDENGLASIGVDDINNGSADACGIASMVLDNTEFTCDNIGDNTVTLTVIDVNGNTSSAAAQVVVVNTAPVILAIDIVEEPAQVGEDLILSATYNDTDLVSATWDWGDGSTTSAPFSDGIINGSHTYTQAGDYDITLIIEDGCGQQAIDYVRDVIIVNPSGGFVTGGGKIESPKGAWSEDKNMSGTLHFAFVAKYKKKDVKPFGVAVIKIKEANINFKSSSINWLVVTEQSAMFEGVGKDRKNKQKYLFRISGVDEGRGWKAEDKFRFQLWEIESGNLVYDNQIGDPINAEATEIIDKGVIVIHQFKEYQPGEEEEEDEKDKDKEDEEDKDKDKEDDDDDKDDDDDDKNKNGERNSGAGLTKVASSEQTLPRNQVKLELYPNPASNVLNIKIDHDITDFNASLKVSVVDSRGQVTVLDEELAISGPQTLNYDVSRLKRGIYFLLIEGPSVRKSTRFIKY